MEVGRYEDQKLLLPHVSVTAFTSDSTLKPAPYKQGYRRCQPVCNTRKVRPWHEVSLGFSNIFFGASVIMNFYRELHKLVTIYVLKTKHIGIARTCHKQIRNIVGTILSKNPPGVNGGMELNSPDNIK